MPNPNPNPKSHPNPNLGPIGPTAKGPTATRPIVDVASSPLLCHWSEAVTGEGAWVRVRARVRVRVRVRVKVRVNLTLTL